MDRRHRTSRFNLQKEATLGFCLKEMDGFDSDIKDRQWKCPFCDTYNLNLPKDDENEAWIKCREIISKHINGHRSALLGKATGEELMKYDKYKGASRARVWVNGTMKDRGLY